MKITRIIARTTVLPGLCLLLATTATARIPAVETASDTLRIAFVTDIHVTPGNEQDSLFRLAVAEIDGSDCDAVICGGDLTNMGTDAELSHVRALFDDLRKPWFVIPGNHETTWSESAGAAFRRAFGHDGRTAFCIGKYLFLGYPSGPWMKMADGGIRREDLAWIQRTAREARRGERIVSLCHYPLTADLTNRREITSLLRACGVDLTLCGHYHRLALRNCDSIACVQGRALVQREADGTASHGYTLVTLAGDSLWMYEKRLGQAPRAACAIRQANDPQVLALPCDPPAEPVACEGFAECVVRDEASIYTGVAVRGDTIFYGTSLGALKAYDTRRRREGWRHRFPNAVYSTPLCASGLVIVGSSAGGLYAFDARTGRERWVLPTPTPVIGDGLLADEGRTLYIGLGNGRMGKVETSTGKLLWLFDFGDGQAQGRPALEGDRLVFGAWDTRLYCLDARTGERLWSWSNGSPQRLFSPGHVVPRIAAGKVFLVAPDRCVTCLDLKSGGQLWRVKGRKARETTGLSADGKRFYFKTMDGEMIALSTAADTYSELWAADAGWGYDHNSCPIVVRDGVAYMANRSGCIAAVREDGTLLRRAKCGNSAANDFTPAPDGTLWVSLAEGTILRIAPVTAE